MAVAHPEEIGLPEVVNKEHFPENCNQNINPTEINVEHQGRRGSMDNDQNQVIIFLYGISGTGKSTTLNYLFSLPTILLV